MEISCVICLNNMTSTEELYVTICGHVCHADCMADWVQRSATCPQCRHPIRQQQIRRIYLNFTNSENSLMDSIMTNHQSELESLRTMLIKKDEQILQGTETIARLENQIKKKDLEQICQINLIKDLRVGIETGKRYLQKQTAKFSEIKVAMQERISELEGINKLAEWQAVAKMFSATDDPVILLQKIAGMKRELTSTVERCRKLEKFRDYFENRFFDELQTNREMAKRLEICAREKLDLEARIAEVKENVKSGKNLVVPKIEKIASASTVRKPKLEARTADGKENVKSKQKPVELKDEKNASKSSTKIQGSRTSLIAIDQNSKPSRYNLRPR